MARGDNIATTVPSVGDAETGGTTDLLTIITALVAIAETKVTPSEIDMDATLDFNSQAAENVKYIEFVTQSSSPGNEILYTKNDGATDELYFTNGSGSDVQITNGGSLNVAATGSITGAGYGSGGVAVNWNAAGTNYQMLQAASTYAAVTCSEVQLYDSTYVIGINPPTLSASYDLTLPASLPAAEIGLTLDASGNVAVSDDSTPYTAYKHATVHRGLFFINADNTNWGTDVSGVVTNTTTSGSQRLSYGVDLQTGDVVTAFKLYYSTNNNPDTVTLDFRKITSSGDTSIDSTTTSSTGTVTHTLASPTTIADDTIYYYKITHTGAASSSHQIDYVHVVYKVS